MVRTRVSFRKVGALRFTSHLDTVGMIQRGLLSSRVPMCYSQGYNPRPKLSFGPPLKTGWEGHDEYIDVYLETVVPDLAARCNPHLPHGLEMKRVVPVPLDAPRLAVDVTAASYQLRIRRADMPAGSSRELHRKLEEGLGVGGGKARILQVAVVEDGWVVGIEYLGRFQESREVRPDEVLEVLGVHGPPGEVVRKALYVERRGRLLSPIEGVKVKRI